MWPTSSVISSFFLSEKKLCHQEVCVFSSAIGRAGVAKVRDVSAKDWDVGL